MRDTVYIFISSFALLLWSVDSAPNYTIIAEQKRMPGIQNDGFPNDPIFIQLRRLATELPGVLFHDEYGIDAGYADVISDVIHLRQVLREVLPSTAFNEQGCLRADATSVAFLATSQYYFIVSFLAIVALGGVCVPSCESTSRIKVV